MSSPEPHISAVVVSFNTKDLTLKCLHSLFMQERVKMRILVVDNGSTDGSAEAIAERFPETQLIEMKGNVGFGVANNTAVFETRDSYALLINSDAWFQGSEALREMIDVMAREPTCAVLGPKLIGTDGRVQIGARRFPAIWREVLDRTELCRLLPAPIRGVRLLGRHADPGQRIECDWVTGACMLVRTSVFKEVGGFPSEIFMYGEELDLCMRIKRAGWRVFFDPAIRVTHAGGGSGAGGWKVGAATAHERYALARDRGELYAWCFTAARAASAVAEWLLFSSATAISGADYHRRRAAQARTVGGFALRELGHRARVVSPPGVHA